MEETTQEHIENLVAKQRHFYLSHKSRELNFRIDALKKLKRSILDHESDLYEALWKDLRKSEQETYLTELGLVLQEIDLHLRNIREWTRPQRVATPLYAFPSKSAIHHDPYGVALIIAPWNYPFQLLLSPLVGAITAGCTVILKPGEKAFYTAGVVERIINAVFDEEYIAVVQGGRATNTYLLKERFDMIFFTGSPSLGKVVMKAAAEHLTPVILELGGKSPCIVDRSANLKVAAKRIAWGKGLNSGQTCVAPDYLFVHKEVKDAFKQHLKAAFKELYGEVKNSPFYARIIDEAAFERISGLMEGEELAFGGEGDASDKFMAPAVLDNVKEDAPVMQEEIFGPLLPLMTYSSLDEVEAYLNKNEKPLALYFFGNKRLGQNLIDKTGSGGVCINDTVIHVGNHHLPFGGVGNSGMGSYHGKRTFEAFSHQKAVLSTSTWIDLPFKYPPFKYFKLIRKIL